MFYGMLRQRPLLSVALALVLGALLGEVIRSVHRDAHISHIIKLQETASYYKCSGDTRANLLCVYNQVLYWNGTIYYIITDPKDRPPVPDIAVPKALDFNPPVQVVTHTELVQRVLNVAGPVQGNIETALLWHRIQPDDLYHALWENVANVHMVACKVLKKCTYQPEDDLQIIFVDSMQHNGTNSFDELWRCLTSKPVEEVGSSRFNTPVLIRALAIGIGYDMEGMPATIGDRYPPSTVMRSSWHVRMKTCFQLPIHTNISSLQPPVATLMVREWSSSGWVLQNQSQVVSTIASELPGFRVQAVTMGNMSLRAQAQLLSQTTVFISAYSSMVAHLLWMPANAVFVELDQYGVAGDVFYLSYVVAPMNEFNYIQHLRVVPSSPASLVCRDSLKADPGFLRLTEMERDLWLQDPLCNYKWLVGRKGVHCNSWIRLHCDLGVEQDRLIKILTIAREFLCDRGVPGPPLRSVQKARDSKQ